MVSLSTVYGVSIVLGSLAAIGSAFVGTKVYPIQTGGDPLAGATALAATVTGAFAAAEKAITPKPEPLATETVKEEPPVVEEPNIEDEKNKINFEENTVGGSVRTYTPDTDRHDKVVYIEKMPSEFFKQQIEFLNTLNEKEKLVLKSYTKDGDFIINSIFRNNYNETALLETINKMKANYDIVSLFGTEDISNENVVDISSKYANVFKAIFDRVPTVTNEFKVFRGTQEPTTNFSGFLSTTYDPMSGRLYDVFSGPSCCIYELTVMPGAKALWLEPISEFPGELEILLHTNSSITIAKQTTKEVWKILTKISPLDKASKTVYEGTVSPKVEEELSPEPEAGGKRKLPPWFKHR